jgi:hypothetical protein
MLMLLTAMYVYLRVDSFKRNGIIGRRHPWNDVFGMQDATNILYRSISCWRMDDKIYIAVVLLVWVGGRCGNPFKVLLEQSLDFGLQALVLIVRKARCLDILECASAHS